MQITIDYKKGHRPGKRRALLDQFTSIGFTLNQQNALWDDLSTNSACDKHHAVIGLLLVNTEVSGYTIDKDA